MSFWDSNNWLLKSLFLLLALLCLTLLYTSSLIGVEASAKNYLKQLKKELKEAGHATQYFVISGRRWTLDNYLLNLLGGAASKSKHLQGQAIDIIVLDVNRDGKCDGIDVGIVYELMDKKVIKNRGGLGSYKNEQGFFNRQMIHFDCRGKKARWNR